MLLNDLKKIRSVTKELRVDERNVQTRQLF